MVFVCDNPTAAASVLSFGLAKLSAGKPMAAYKMKRPGKFRGVCSNAEVKICIWH